MVPATDALPRKNESSNQVCFQNLNSLEEGVFQKPSPPFHCHLVREKKNESIENDDDALAGAQPSPCCDPLFVI